MQRSAGGSRLVTSASRDERARARAGRARGAASGRAPRRRGPAPLREVELGLVGDDELVAADRRAELAEQREAVAVVVVAVGLVDATPRAGGLGLVHGDVGALQRASAASSPCSGASAMPMLASTRRSMPRTSTGAAAPAPASVVGDGRGRRRRPPAPGAARRTRRRRGGRRCRASPSRVAQPARPTSMSSSSPWSWPSVSLISLKPSRSTSSSGGAVLADGLGASALEQQRAVRQAGERVVRGLVAVLVDLAAQRRARCGGRGGRAQPEDEEAAGDDRPHLQTSRGRRRRSACSRGRPRTPTGDVVALAQRRVHRERLLARAVVVHAARERAGRAGRSARP